MTPKASDRRWTGLTLVTKKGTEAKCNYLRGLVAMRAHFTLAGLNGGQPKHFSHPLVEDQLSGLPARTLGSLQGIELHNLLGTELHVGGEIAGAVFPLDLRFWAGLAINALR